VQWPRAPRAWVWSRCRRRFRKRPGRAAPWSSSLHPPDRRPAASCWVASRRNRRPRHRRKKSASQATPMSLIRSTLKPSSSPRPRLNRIGVTVAICDGRPRLVSDHPTAARLGCTETIGSSAGYSGNEFRVLCPNSASRQHFTFAGFSLCEYPPVPRPQPAGWHCRPRPSCRRRPRAHAHRRPG